MSFLMFRSRKSARRASLTSPARMEALDSRTLLSGDVITASPLTLAPTEGHPATAVTVATFTDSLVSDASNFSATIDWGDGSPTDNATITLDASGNFYDVVGSHTYVHAGHDPIAIAINNNVSGSTAQTQSTANVANDTLTATGVTLNAVEGTPLNASAVLASFTDANAAATAADFTATITWANGVTSAAQVVANANGGFNVVGSHRYDSVGDKPVTIDITGAGGGAAQAASTVHVTDAPITAAAVRLRLRDNKAATRTIATFTDANAFDAANNFKAFMYIGRHARRGYACSVIIVGAGKYAVVGNFRFSAVGNYPVHIVILDNGGAVATADSSATVY